MKRLFTEDQQWTDEGRELSRKAHKALKPLFLEYGQEYELRDIEHIVSGEAQLLMFRELAKLRGTRGKT